MRNRILLVSTYNNLTIQAKKISEEMNLNVDVFEGGIMKNGHIYAKEHQNLYDVIISQGGTVQAIKSLVTVPVVEVETRTADFLTALHKAKQFGGKIGLVVYASENVFDLENIKEMLNIDFEIFVYSSKEALIEQIEEAIKIGVTTLVGMGDCITETGKTFNLNTIVIHGGVKQVNQALISAKNICDYGSRKKEKTERFKAIIDYSGDGIIALDNKHTIVTLNPIAERIFNLKASQVLDQSIHNNVNSVLIEEIFGDGGKLLNKLVVINSKQFLMNRLPIIIEGQMYSIVMTFQEVTKLQELEQKVRTQLYKKGLLAKYSFDDISGESETIQNTISQAKMISKTNTTVLISAETGSGKELFAQSIHNYSTRKNGPFVTINCAAMPENLLESELFGYEDGAFTGAKKGGKPGLFELAHGGTIFLDEVSEMPLSLQGRLLRVLQEREVQRIGGDYLLNVNIRVIAATNMNLFNLVKEGKFRQDLYFRLNILDLRIPPLRERKDDIPVLIKAFINKMNIKHNTNISTVSDGAIKLLQGYDWPGNVRELENFTEKISVLSYSSIIDEKMVALLFYSNSNFGAANKEKIINTDVDSITIKLGSLRDIEHQIIMQTSEIFKHDKTALAEKLGMSRTTLWKRLKEIEETKQ